MVSEERKLSWSHRIEFWFSSGSSLGDDDSTAMARGGTQRPARDDAAGGGSSSEGSVEGPVPSPGARQKRDSLVTVNGSDDPRTREAPTSELIAGLMTNMGASLRNIDDLLGSDSDDDDDPAPSPGAPRAAPPAPARRGGTPLLWGLFGAALALGSVNDMAN